MNKFSKIALGILLLMPLTSCIFIKETSSNDGFDSQTSDIPSSNITSTTTPSSSHPTSVDVSNLEVMHFDHNTCPSRIFGYDTGSFGEFRTFSTLFEVYRAYKSGREVLRLIAYDSITGVEGLPSAFYNKQAIYGIQRIEIKYHSYGKVNAAIRFGESRELENKVELPSKQKSFTIDIDNANFFSIENYGDTLNIDDIKVYYSNERTEIPEYRVGSGDSEYRVNLPTADYNNLVHNKTKVTMPIKGQVVNGEYKITESKTYTYYDYQEVRGNKSLAKKIALTDPVDISNYYIAFGTFPANYVYKNNYWEAEETFGDKTRCVSRYTRTDGYALSVPYKSQPGNHSPLYYELDLDLDGRYSSGQRGAGRLVAWHYGFDEKRGAVGYEQNKPVIVYTDDHYATFREYLGVSRFTTNFDSEIQRTAINWSNPTTLSL